MQSAQPRHMRYSSNVRETSSSEELIDHLSEDHISDHSSNASFGAGSSARTAKVEGHDEQSSVASTSRKPLKSRPNKHQGAGSTWRSRTAPERQLAASLDQLRAKDLSMHLYNFYALKRQQTQGGPETNTPSFGKDWASSKSWTAWPMIPELVPRESDEISWGNDADHFKFETISSYEAMQELLAAQACKKAKIKFSEREWEDTNLTSQSPPGDRRLRDQARLTKLTDDSDDAEEDEPMILADDQFARSILQPSLNHVAGKLDTLLIGLHHARASYSLTSKRTSRLYETVDDESSMDNKRRRKVSSKGRSTKRKSRPKDSAVVSENLSSGEDEPHQGRGRRSGSDRRAVKPLSRSRSRIDRLGLRDWSDVLGVASMCGWDSGVVARAAARCSDLFNEGIVFRTLHEGREGYHDSSFVPNTFTTQILEGLGEEGSHAQSTFYQGHNPDEEGSEPKIGGVHVDGFLQPIPKQASWTRKRKPRER
ncbi:MAG: hypothetical protein Q9216_006138 [Gyalolechia sp. 2 TL-2023]